MIKSTLLRSLSFWKRWKEEKKLTSSKVDGLSYSSDVGISESKFGDDTEENLFM